MLTQIDQRLKLIYKKEKTKVEVNLKLEQGCNLKKNEKKVSKKSKSTKSQKSSKSG